MRHPVFVLQLYLLTIANAILSEVVTTICSLSFIKIIIKYYSLILKVLSLTEIITQWLAAIYRVSFHFNILLRVLFSV